MTWVTIFAVVAVIFCGALIQRSTGMGFALVAAPFLVILVGPVTGVVLVNFASVIAAVAIFVRVRREVEWRRYALLAGPALLGIVPGSVLALMLPTSALELGIGAVLVGAILITVLVSRRDEAVLVGSIPPGIAGFLSGITNSAAGIGGPPVSLYAVLSAWPHRSFVATAQPYFATIGLVSLLVKLAVDPSRWPNLPWWAWTAGALAIVGGLVLGEKIQPLISPPLARRVVLAIAFCGSAALCISAALAIANVVGGHPE